MGGVLNLSGLREGGGYLGDLRPGSTACLNLKKNFLKTFDAVFVRGD
jgi:hypothetical protein